MQQPEIIYEDNVLLIISKPPQLVVNRAESVNEPTLQDWIEDRSYWQKLIAGGGERGGAFWARSGVVHRLDKETSGIMIVAKTEEAFINITEQFKLRLIKKTYLCLVHGILTPREGGMSLPLSRSKQDREKFGVSTGGKPAQTFWKVLETFSTVQLAGVRTRGYQGFSYLEVRPKTGRTHQIRVHLHHLGHPVVGDGRYTGKKRHREDSKWCQRQFLHAQRIEFTHPKTQKTVSFEAELAEDLKKCSAKLIGNDNA